MEFFDIYDSNNHPLNKVKERSLVHRDGDWHRTSQVWVMNRSKKILCNLRSKEKDLFPGYWDLTIGGHVLAGKTYEETAQRELFEELGLVVMPEEIIYLSDEKVEGRDVVRNLIDREHARLFLYKTERGLPEFKVQKEEIEKIEYISIKDLMGLTQSKSSEFKVIPIKKHYMKIIQILNDLY